MPKTLLPELTTRVTVPLTSETRDRLSEQARKEGRGVSNLIRLILTDYLEKSA
jgi:CopG-like RHH_1 or ribbon-helix-helix domain, RHH_5